MQLMLGLIISYPIYVNQKLGNSKTSTFYFFEMVTLYFKTNYMYSFALDWRGLADGCACMHAGHVFLFWGWGSGCVCINEMLFSANLYIFLKSKIH